MLCREGQLETQCWIESADAARIVIRRGGGREPLTIDTKSVTELIFDVSLGKLLLVLRDTTFELMPQSTDELDVVSGLVARYLALKGEAPMSRVVEVLRAFCRVAQSAVEVVAALQEDPGKGLDWARIGRATESADSAVEELLGVAPAALSLLGGLSVDLASAVKGRCVRGLGSGLRTVLAGAYEVSRGELSRVLPGTYPEVLLDLALLFVLNSAASSGKLKTTEEEARALLEESEVLMERLSRLLGVERGLFPELEALLRSGSGELESFVEKLAEALSKNLAGGIRATEEELV